MLIKNLKILNQNTSELIRNIDFKLNGLNLIIDSTSKKSDDSGNGVGKTTAVQVIDLCLGAKDLKELYEDKDTKGVNEELKNFLFTNKITAILTIVDKNNNEILLKRNLYSTKDSEGSTYINDKKYKITEYTNELKKIFFSSNEKKPSFRQLLPKFIRLQNYAESNILRYLTNATDKDYRSIYSFLFKIMDDEKINKISLNEKAILTNSKEIKTLKKLNKISSLDALKQKLEIINNETEKLKKERNEISYIESYKDVATEKIKIETEIKMLQEQFEIKNFEITKISNTISEIEKQKESIDMESLKNIYEEAQLYIPNMLTKFSELVEFHNAMLDNRIIFMEKRFKEKILAKEKIENRITLLLEKSKEIIIDKLEMPLIIKFGNLNNKIEELMSQKGEIENNIKILDKLEKNNETLRKEIEELKSSTDTEIGKENIAKFNLNFPEFSEKLYGKRYFLSFNTKDNNFPVAIEELNAKLGTGEKKGLMAAFDLAYLKYSNDLNISAPRFVIHDKLELTHINQLSNIFDICKNISGQYILPILRERIESDEKITTSQIEEAKILELSQTSKFFKF